MIELDAGAKTCGSRCSETSAELDFNLVLGADFLWAGTGDKAEAILCEAKLFVLVVVDMITDERLLTDTEDDTADGIVNIHAVCIDLFEP